MDGGPTRMSDQLKADLRSAIIKQGWINPAQVFGGRFHLVRCLSDIIGTYLKKEYFWVIGGNYFEI